MPAFSVVETATVMIRYRGIEAETPLQAAEIVSTDHDLCNAASNSIDQQMDHGAIASLSYDNSGPARSYLVYPETDSGSEYLFRPAPDADVIVSYEFQARASEMELAAVAAVLGESARVSANSIDDLCSSNPIAFAARACAASLTFAEADAARRRFDAMIEGLARARDSIPHESPAS